MCSREYLYEGKLLRFFCRAHIDTERYSLTGEGEKLPSCLLSNQEKMDFLYL